MRQSRMLFLLGLLILFLIIVILGLFLVKSREKSDSEITSQFTKEISDVSLKHTPNAVFRGAENYLGNDDSSEDMKLFGFIGKVAGKITSADGVRIIEITTEDHGQFSIYLGLDNEEFPLLSIDGDDLPQKRVWEITKVSEIYKRINRVNQDILVVIRYDHSIISNERICVDIKCTPQLSELAAESDEAVSTMINGENIDGARLVDINRIILKK